MNDLLDFLRHDGGGCGAFGVLEFVVVAAVAAGDEAEREEEEGEDDEGADEDSDDYPETKAEDGSAF